MRMDFNVLERRAAELMDTGRFREAIRIYTFMGDGDPSLDGGYLGMKLGECYEQLGEFIVARYWYGRAVEENPVVRAECAAARERLQEHTLDDLVPRDSYVIPDKSAD